MARIVLEHFVAAPPEGCFDLARSVEHHIASTAGTDERVVGGRASGLFEAGDTVTWEARHFWIRQRLTSRIVECDPPRTFVDQQISGPFKCIAHRHEFVAKHGGTQILDTFEFQSPFGLLGRLVDALIMKRYLHNLLEKRNAYLKFVAEQPK